MRTELRGYLGRKVRQTRVLSVCAGLCARLARRRRVRRDEVHRVRRRLSRETARF